MIGEKFLAEEFLKDLFYEGARAVHPQQCLEGRLLSLPDNGRVIGAGKSAAAMVKAVEDQRGNRASGVVVARYGHRQEYRFIEAIEADPLPNRNGVMEEFLKTLE